MFSKKVFYESKYSIKALDNKSLALLLKVMLTSQSLLRVEAHLQIQQLATAKGKTLVDCS